MLRHILTVVNLVGAALAAFFMYVVMPYSRQLVCESWRMHCAPSSQAALIFWTILPIAIVMLSLWLGRRLRASQPRVSLALYLWFPLFLVVAVTFILTNQAPSVGA